MSSAMVIGAGPVGLTLALELARYGVPVRIVDKAPARSTTSKALVVWSRTLELLERSGCSPAFVAAGNKITGATIAAGIQRIGRVTFDGVATPYPYALMLPQSDTERILETHLNVLGVSVEREVEIVRLSSTEGSVVGVLRLPDGSEEEFETSWLAGCDGAHSFVRRSLQMEFVGDTLPSDWVLADVHLTGMTAPESELQLIWHEDGLLAFFPISPGRYRMIADTGVSEGGHGRRDPTLEEVQALIEKRGPGGIHASNPIWLSAFHINERKVTEYCKGRVFLAGDAAHIHSPAGGQGMNTGMQDAFNLAWKLALVRRGTCAPEPLLHSYSPERGAVGAQILEATGRLTALGVTKNRTLQFVRNHVAPVLFGLSGVREKMAETLTEISVGYPRSPLNRTENHVRGTPAAGERAPVRSGDPPFGEGSAPRFALCADPREDAARTIALNADLLEPVIRAPFHENGLWLVRPDGYIALVARSGAWASVHAYLELIRGRGAPSRAAATPPGTGFARA